MRAKFHERASQASNAAKQVPGPAMIDRRDLDLFGYGKLDFILQEDNAALETLPIYLRK
jgi:hypothetical protein